MKSPEHYVANGPLYVKPSSNAVNAFKSFDSGLDSDYALENVYQIAHAVGKDYYFMQRTWHITNAVSLNALSIKRVVFAAFASNMKIQ